MQISLWKNFNKRKNSTKRPGTADAVLDVLLKDNTSIESPSFILSGQNFEYNYAAAFGHYYFITDIISLSNNRMQINCTQDLLATYKSNILATTAFVTRAQSEYKEMLPDPNVAIYNQETQVTASLSTGFVLDGTYILSVLNNDGSGVGFTCYYALSRSTMKSLAGYCNQNLADVESITQIVEWLQATFLKTADAVIDCKWVPISYSTYGAASGIVNVPLKIGKDFVAVGEHQLYGYRIDQPVTFTSLQTYSMGGIYSDFRKGQPYTKAFLYIPFYGMYQFNPLDFGSDLNIRMSIDAATGDTTVFLNNGDTSKTIASINYNLSVNCPVGKVGSEATGALTSTVGAAGSTYMALTASSLPGAIAAGVGAAASAINAASSAFAISPSVKGVLSGRSMADKLNYQILLVQMTTSNPGDLTVHCGRPLMASRTLSSLSGFVQCAQASVNMPGLSDDKELINEMLDSGIFIE